MEPVLVKEEVSDKDYILVEDDIKIEETCLQSRDQVINSVSGYAPSPPKRVIIEQKLLICSMCKRGFARNKSVKIWSESDLYKCNKCILHSRLNHVFKMKTFGKKRKNRKTTNKRKKVAVQENDSDIVVVDSSEEEKFDSIVITKCIYFCAICDDKFERRDTTGLHHASDWYKCNKCILHTRLNSVFKPNRKIVTQLS